MKKYILTLDQGTTSSRAIIYDKNGQIVSSAKKEYRQIYPRPGWVEHDPEEIWASQLSSAVEAIAIGGIDPSEIAAIGITNQRETTVIWDKNTGKPVYNAIVWQCRRTSDFCEELKKEGVSQLIRNKTGLLADPYFSGTKVKWILDNVDGARKRAEKGELLFGTVDCWLINRLTKGREHLTDVTNASRTMMFNIHEMKWDDDLLRILDIPSRILPDVRNSSSCFGYTDFFGGVKIPICGVAGDQQSSLFGQKCFSSGDVKNTYGTGCFMLMNTGDRPVNSENGLLTTVAWQIGKKPVYALEGSVFIAGAAVQWLRDGLGIIASASECELIARSVPDCGGVYFVPAFTGLGAPYWNPDARGLICGISRGTERAHIVRATIESMAYQTDDVIKLMETESGIRLASLRIDGGASANNFLAEFQSEISDIRVIRPDSVETTSLGASMLAGLGSGFYADIGEIKALPEKIRVFSPEMNSRERMKLIQGWKTAVNRTM
ncbi:MAG: glycerol kinase GlpK [Clostridia bacterium]|nr:glycerol kinase GlpK [Clostridia bacterium]